jgi:hypothetical protein
MEMLPNVRVGEASTSLGSLKSTGQGSFRKCAELFDEIFLDLPGKMRAEMVLLFGDFICGFYP